MNITGLLFIGLGGFAGAVARYIVFEFAHSIYHKTSFPFGTLVVNLLGSLIIGILLALSLKFPFLARHHAGHYLIVTGFLGAFTTFSTFSQDNMVLLFDKQYTALSINVLINVALGLTLVIAGYSLTRRLL